MSTIRTMAIWVLVGAIGLGLAVLVRPVQADEAVKDFSLLDQNGKVVSLSDYRGKFVVLEWTNPQCPFVQRHYRPDTMTMVKLAKAYKEKGVVWLAINSTNFLTQQDNKEWADSKQLPYPVLDDHEGDVGRLYGATNTPHMFVLDKQGKVVYQGAIDNNGSGTQRQPVNYVAAVLDDLLAGDTPSYVKTKPYGCTVKYAR